MVTCIPLFGAALFSMYGEINTMVMRVIDFTHYQQLGNGSVNGGHLLKAVSASMLISWQAWTCPYDGFDAKFSATLIKLLS